MPTSNIERAEDDPLVQAVQRGDPDAFEPLLDRHLHHVRAFLALKSPVPQLVDELAHETFVFAFRNLEKFTPGTSFRAWLRAIAWNLLRAEIQRFSREQANHARFVTQRLDDWMRQPAEPPAGRDVEYLEECVREMPEPMGELLALKYRDECSTDEIAHKLERSLAWVRTVLFRLRQQLRQCIEGKLSKERPC